MEDSMKKLFCLLVLLLVAAGSANAITGIEIGVKGGIVDNYSQSGLTISDYSINRMNLLGGQVSFSRLPMVDVLVSADYSWRNETYEIAGQGFEFKMRDFAVTASVVYPFKFQFVTPYVGAGIGTHSLSYEYVRPISLSLADNGIAIPATSSFFGYHGILGAKANLPAFPLGFFIEGRLNRIRTPGDDITFNTYTGGVYFALP
jgi:opacity protein-like surface antigen